MTRWDWNALAVRRLESNSGDLFTTSIMQKIGINAKSNSTDHKLNPVQCSLCFFKTTPPPSLSLSLSLSQADRPSLPLPDRLTHSTDLLLSADCRTHNTDLSLYLTHHWPALFTRQSNTHHWSFSLSLSLTVGLKHWPVSTRLLDTEHWPLSIRMSDAQHWPPVSLYQNVQHSGDSDTLRHISSQTKRMVPMVKLCHKSSRFSFPTWNLSARILDNTRSPLLFISLRARIPQKTRSQLPFILWELYIHSFSIAVHSLRTIRSFSVGVHSLRTIHSFSVGVHSVRAIHPFSVADNSLRAIHIHSPLLFILWEPDIHSQLLFILWELYTFILSCCWFRRDLECLTECILNYVHMFVFCLFFER